jgi:putative phage-type endonuclease
VIADVAGNFRVIDAPQRSAEWFAARCGKVTGSVAAAMMARGKGKDVESVQRRDLRIRLALERITNQPDEAGYVSPEMQRGTDLEPEAIAAFEVLTGQMVTRTGFLSHNVLLAGCSLDGHIGEFETIVEAKCPKSSTHLSYIRDGGIPDTYRFQIQHNLFITNANACEFISYDPRMPPELQLFRVRVSIDAFDMPAYHLALTLFLSEVDKEVTSILALAGAA